MKKSIRGCIERSASFFGSIYRGELSLVTPEQDTTSFSQTDLPSIINNYNIGFYGTLQYVNFYDYQFAKKQFAGTLKFYEGSWGARIALGENCTHWYLLHIEYNLNTGEVLDYFTVDLGCLTCPPNSLCDEFDGFGGGGGQLDPVSFSVHREVEMYRVMEPYNMYVMKANYQIEGTKNLNLSNSQSAFTNVTLIAPYITFDILQGTTEPYIFVIDSYSHHEDWATSTAKCDISVQIRYPYLNNFTKSVPGIHIFNITEF